MSFEKISATALREDHQDSVLERVAQYTNHQLTNQGVTEAFSPLAFASLPEIDPCRTRQDLRSRLCLTIDCDHTKDMDDAVSLERLNNGWLLGVYIADVSSYVTPGSPMDQEAMARGTSIYLPDRTIPMLPPVLSNDLCSLNPNEDRRVIAAMIRLDEDTNVTGFQLTKALIRSRVKGVYSEVARLLEGTADHKLTEKYASVLPSLREMDTLARLLRGKRVGNGVTVATSGEPEIVLTANGIDLLCRERNAAENIVEEFMVLANREVANYMDEHQLPALYRAQTKKQTLAFYSPNVSQHAELVLERYVHFTSPIRRLADLKVHQILSEHLNGADSAELSQRYGTMMQEASEQAVKRSRRANGIQKACTLFCYRQYFMRHAQTVYTGCVTGYNKNSCPVIQIDRFRVNTLGAAAVCAAVGQKVRLQVGVNRHDRLVAHHVTFSAA